MHASISRLEVVRTPIQWAWTSLFEEIWVPLMSKYYKYNVKDDNGRRVTVAVAPIFEKFTRTAWVWPDVTPRDSIKAAELAMNLSKAGLLSDEGAMQRAQIPSVVDEVEKIRKQRQDDIMHPLDVRSTLMVRQMEQQLEMMAQQQAAMNMQNAPGELDQAMLEEGAAKSPRLGVEDNVPQGSQANAVQGLQQSVPPQIG